MKVCRASACSHAYSARSPGKVAARENMALCASSVYIYGRPGQQQRLRFPFFTRETACLFRAGVLGARYIARKIVAHAGFRGARIYVGPAEMQWVVWRDLFRR